LCCRVKFEWSHKSSQMNLCQWGLNMSKRDVICYHPSFKMSTRCAMMGKRDVIFYHLSISFSMTIRHVPSLILGMLWCSISYISYTIMFQDIVRQVCYDVSSFAIQNEYGGCCNVPSHLRIFWCFITHLPVWATKYCDIPFFITMIMDVAPKLIFQVRSYGPLAKNTLILSFQILCPQVTTNSLVPAIKFLFYDNSRHDYVHHPHCLLPALMRFKEWWKFVIFFALKATEITTIY